MQPTLIEYRKASFFNRSIASADCREAMGEVRAAGRKIIGLISYNTLSLDLGGYKEIVRPGAFSSALQGKDDVIGTFDHGLPGGQVPLGRLSSGTLKLSDSPEGLRYEIDPPDSELARAVVGAIQRRDIIGSSFAFTVNGPDGESWDRQKDGSMVRSLRSVRLSDVAVVQRPAYPQSTAAVRFSPEVAAELRSADKGLHRPPMMHRRTERWHVEYTSYRNRVAKLAGRR